MNSKLQIISGKYRGKKLILPPLARPTQNMARGALFNMLNEILDISHPFVVWDVFAGSGAFGLECLSRYENAKAIFTDNSNLSMDTIKKNVKSIGCDAIIEKTDAVAAIPKFGAIADLIFVDAPYADFDLGVAFVKKLTAVAKIGAILIWEFEKFHDVPVLDNWNVIKDKIYGRARFLILKKK